MKSQNKKSVSGEFEYLGRFSENNCRDLLTIKRRQKQTNKPNALVIMMNPGSSKPLDEKIHNKLTDLKKIDATQYQIARLMEKVGWDFVNVINLSNIRDKNSEKFYELCETEDDTGAWQHSIFNKKNGSNKHLKELLQDVDVVVLAWGKSKRLQPLINQVIPVLKQHEKFPTLHFYGVQTNLDEDKDDTAIDFEKADNFKFYHPLQRGVNAEKWVNKLAALIKNK